ncbi:MAG: DUF4145 domain-containing protein [Desulfarculus sp.]|nr:DUF4145 domain-containing protein [Desulfarculus sp.]
MPYNWDNLGDVVSRSYVCGYCGEKISSNRGYYGKTEIAARSVGANRFFAAIYVCHSCSKPTFFQENGYQVPGPVFGSAVKHIPSKEVENLYNEARNCVSVNAYTAASLCLRKLLMNLAISEGAQEGISFVQYIDFLEQEGHITPKNRVWVDHIRKMGNIATHEIKVVTREEAEQLIRFCEMLLKSSFEYPASLPTP